MATKARQMTPKPPTPQAAPTAAPTPEKSDYCRPLAAWPLSAALILVVLLVSIFTVLNCYELGLMKGREQLLAKKVVELETRVADTKAAAVAVTEPAPRMMEGKILAGAPDNSFVLRGTLSCSGEFSIGPSRVDPNDAKVRSYDIIHPITMNDSDLGMVQIKPIGAYESDPSGTYIEAFRNDSSVVEATFTDGATAPDCRVWVAEE